MAWTPQNIFTNPNFENGDKGSPWVPDGWTASSSSTLWSYAAFDDLATGGIETFEGGWGREKQWPEDQNALGWRHKTADRSDLSGLSVDDLASSITSANTVKAVANAHFGDTTYHVIADPRTITSPDATDEASLITLINELYSDCGDHADDPTPTWHRYKGYGWDEPIGEIVVIDWDTAMALFAAVIVGFGRHLWWRSASFRWQTFSVVNLTQLSTDPTLGYLLLIDNWDEADTSEPDAVEDFEEGWTSLYLDSGVQTSLGTNDDRIEVMTPLPATFAYGDETETFEMGWGAPRHIKADETDLEGQDISDLTGAILTANLIRATAVAHFPSTVYHTSADSRVITASPATDLPSLLLLVNELYDDTRAHALDSLLDWHRTVTDTQDVPFSNDYPATDLATAQKVLAQILIGFGRHLWWRGNDHGWNEFTYPPDLTDLNVAGEAYLDLAIFDVAEDLYEDFEQEWGGNENRLTEFTIPTNLELAVFEEGTADGFEFSRPFTNEPTAPNGISDELEVDKNKGFYFFTTGTWTATYQLQAQRGVGGSWITLIEFTDNSTPLEAPPGYSKVRIFCVAFTSSTDFAGFIGWERLDVF